MSSAEGEKRINRKRLEHLERIQQKKQSKFTKTKQKKLARIVERKKQKQTRDSLVAQLLEYQLNESCIQGLVSTAKMQQKLPGTVLTSENINQPVVFPKKLRCISGKDMKASQQVERKQNNYYETDSSSDDEEMTEICNKTNKEAEGAQIKEEVRDEHDTISDEAMEINKSDSIGHITQPAAGILNQEETEHQRKLALEKANAFFTALSKIKGNSIAVPRMDKIELQRRLLPIHAEEQQIVEAINENTVVVICGETGSGKSSQIPQFLYEAGYTSNDHLIVVTEPRRIAAISMSERVGYELNNSSLSSYQIRFEGNRTDATRILFMTDGVLLRELQADVTLSKFSVVVIDEAHERSMYTDVLIGLLSRICVARLKRGTPLKLVIMSATLRLSDFVHERLFPKIRPKVINVASRQFPVTVHFERHTPEDYLKAAFKKVCKIHQQLPVGGILVFVSGQREVHQLIKWLEMKYPTVERKSKKKRRRESRKYKTSNKSEIGTEVEINDRTNEDMVVDYDEFGVDTDFMPSDGKLNQELPDELIEDSDEDETRIKFQPLHCLPLYSLLSSAKQKLVFDPAPEGTRLCVVATNIRYVVDSGKEKRREFDSVTGVSRFNVTWISRASADQRSGRAGRVQAGHTYRLYSSAVYEDFQKFSPPEILCTPIEQLVLHLKSMKFMKLRNFPFPTPPDEERICIAEERLTHLGALEKRKSSSDATITRLGQTLVQIPTSPHFAKCLVLSNKHNLMPYMITLVSALSVREPLSSILTLNEATALETQNKMAEILKLRKAWCGFGEARHLGDLCVLLNSLGAMDYINAKEISPTLLQKHGINPKAYWEIRKLRTQLIKVLNNSTSLNEKLDLDLKLSSSPTQEQMKMLRQIFTNCLPENIAMRIDRSVESEVEVPKGAYKCQRLQDFTFIDVTSMVYKYMPDYVLYQDVQQIGNKICLQNVMAVEAEWVPEYIKNRLKMV
ncbi:helicase associated domain (HA2) domain-containing protein [Ditylenchus destructor]|uniref:RNA helicase n=1 Tax=Ditylenchus destructor TaxID=166010 RepID=A0AAD4N9A3_9BILA|nr:helicase associated domain (HA2) domain-containing protein [Ditylenchus destructor]